MSGSGKTTQSNAADGESDRGIQAGGRALSLVGYARLGIGYSRRSGAATRRGISLYRVKGAAKVKRLSLGRYGDPGASLEEARDRAGELTSAARQGVDLIASEAEAREAASRAISWKSSLSSISLVASRPRLRSAREVERILKRVLAPLATMPAASVRRRDLSPLLEAIAARGHERAAGNARTLIGGLFRWGEEQDIVASDPTRGLPKYDLGSPRDRVLDADEIRAVWPWFDSLGASRSPIS